MANHYLEILSTPAVVDARNKYYGKPGLVPSGTEPDPLTDDEIEFIRTRDSFYTASVAENGWPYIQHRGGPPGFLHVTGPSTLAFADYRGNRQLLSTGNVTADDRVSLFLMDYPHRTRLKILGRGRVVNAREQPQLAESLAGASDRKLIERIFLIDVLSFDWNCHQHITQRFTLEEINAYVAPLRNRIHELESELELLRKQADPQLA